MSFTAGSTVLSSAQTVAVGSDVPSTNPGAISSGSGGVISGTITNGATAPTSPCTVELQISSDGTTWRTIDKVGTGTGASTAYDFAFDVPENIVNVRLLYTGVAGTAVTADAELFYAASL